MRNLSIHSNLLLVSILALMAGNAGAQTVQYSAPDANDVWVYEHSGDPAGDYYLRCWVHNSTSDLWPTFPPPADASYSYAQWDLSGQFDSTRYYFVSSARLTLTHKRSPAWNLSQPNVLLRKVASNWDESSWDFLDPAMPQPAALVSQGDRSAYVASNSTFPVTFDLKNQVFEDMLNAATSNGKISFALTTLLDPLGPFGANHYQFFSRDWPDVAVTPKLEINATSVPGYRIKGNLLLNNYNPKPSLEIVTFELRQPNTQTIVETHRVIPDENGDYELVVWHSGNYDLAVKGETWLRSVKAINTGANPTGVDFSLTNGDVNNDNTVDDFDLFDLTNDFLQAPSPGKRTDLNGDRTVDDFDLFILTQSFLTQGQP